MLRDLSRLRIPINYAPNFLIIICSLYQVNFGYGGYLSLCSVGYLFYLKKGNKLKLKVFSKIAISLCLLLFVVNAWAIRIAYLHGLEISGRVTLAGKPVANASIELRNGNCLGEATVKAKTKSDGTYRFIEESFYPFSTYYIAVSATASHAEHCVFAGVKLPDNVATRKKLFYAIALNKPKAPTSAEQQCTKSGGRWAELGAGRYGCNVTFRDASKDCTDNSQCSSKTCFASWVPPRLAWMSRHQLIKHGNCAVDTFQLLTGGANPKPIGVIKQGKVIPRTFN